MKKRYLPFLLVLFFSCSEKDSGVKIIENYDEAYLTSEEVQKSAGSDEEYDQLVTDLKEVVSNAASKAELPAKAYLNYRVYISEEGKVDGIKELPLPSKIANMQIELIERILLTSLIAEQATSWHFTPALHDGERVKFRSDIELFFSVDEEGNVTHESTALKSMGKSLSKLTFDRSEDIYYVVVEEQPSPVGGLKAIQEKIRYPEEAKQNGIEGRVFVKAFINEEGAVERVELLKGIGYGCDIAAMQAVMDTEFTPGKQRGEPVKVQVSIPIVFKLQ